MARKNSKTKLVALTRMWGHFQSWPWITLGLIFVQGMILVVEQRALNVGVIHYMIEDYSFYWTDFVAHPFQNAPRLISHTFLHANFQHFIWNALFFLMFAPAIEKKMGPLLFFLGYLFWGAMAALVQGFFTPFSRAAIGASGAISGAAGAFFVLYPLKPPPQFAGFLLGQWVR